LYGYSKRTRTHLNAARVSAAGEGLTEPLHNFYPCGIKMQIESVIVHHRKVIPIGVAFSFVRVQQEDSNPSKCGAGERLGFHSGSVKISSFLPWQALCLPRQDCFLEKFFLKYTVRFVSYFASNR